MAGTQVEEDVRVINHRVPRDVLIRIASQHWPPLLPENRDLSSETA